jgi:hypothetical protein
MKSSLMISMFCLILLPFGLKAQSVFAPKIGAEWRYFFITADYDTDMRYRTPRRGMLYVKYEKDTVISGLIVKKMTQVETFRKKGNDTLYTYSKKPLFMRQKSDSILILDRDTFALAFAYKTGLLKDSSYSIYPLSRSRELIFKLLRLSDTSALNNSMLKFKKHTYNGATKLLDVYFTDPLILLDRIGSINSDLSVIQSQMTGVNDADIYKLVCYKDSEVGELLFSGTNCENFVSTKDLLDKNNLSILNTLDFIEISSINFMNNVKIYDIEGKLIRIFHNCNTDKLSVLKNTLPKGILFITVQDKDLNIYSAKKISNL